MLSTSVLMKFVDLSELMASILLDPHCGAFNPLSLWSRKISRKALCAVLVLKGDYSLEMYQVYIMKVLTCFYSITFSEMFSIPG